MCAGGWEKGLHKGGVVRLKFWKRGDTGLAAQAVQLRSREVHPFAQLRNFTPQRSGELRLYQAVREAVQFYKIPADHVLVIYDDVSLPVGKLRVRPTGSAGGHNGIKNIIAHLGTQDFPRIKIGTGAPGEGGDMIDWVIGVPSQAERKVLVESFRRAIDAAECIIEHGCQKAMNDFN